MLKFLWIKKMLCGPSCPRGWRFAVCEIFFWVLCKTSVIWIVWKLGLKCDFSLNLSSAGAGSLHGHPGSSSAWCVPGLVRWRHRENLDQEKTAEIHGEDSQFFGRVFAEASQFRGVKKKGIIIYVLFSCVFCLGFYLIFMPYCQKEMKTEVIALPIS